MLKSWLKPLKNKPDKALCTVCNRELAAVVTALRKHKDAAYHKERVSALVDPTLGRLTSMLVIAQWRAVVVMLKCVWLVSSVNTICPSTS